MKVPNFNLKRIFQLRTAIYDAIRLDLAGIELYNHDVKNLGDRMLRLMPGPISQITMFESVRVFERQILNDAELRTFAWRMAANADRLRAGMPVTAWRSPGIEEWVPVQVMRVEPFRTSKSGTGRVLFTLRVLAGTAAALEIQKPFKVNSLPVIARAIGFTSRHRRYPYQTYFHFVGLRFLVKLDPAKATDAAPSFFHVHGANNLIAFNRRILAVRLRRKPCPRRFNSPCKTCAVGYMHCDFAVHKFDFVSITCSSCRQPGWSDPERSTTLCLKCHTTQAIQEASCPTQVPPTPPLSS